MSKDDVKIVEVGARDGLQNEKTVVSTDDKFQFINLLGESGLKFIEASSFVRPDSIPQLSDAYDLIQKLNFNNGIDYSFLIPNKKGMERALETKAKSFAFFSSTSNSFNKKNINCTIEESLDRFLDLKKLINSPDFKMRGYISTVFGCPYEGETSIDECLRLMEFFFKNDVSEVSLGDTIGVGTPEQTIELINQIKNNFDLSKIAMHFHDTERRAIDNIKASIAEGIRIFDSSAGGLGGCPYAKGATGNVATEDVLIVCKQKGLETGVDIEKIKTASDFMLKIVNKENQSQLL